MPDTATAPPAISVSPAEPIEIRPFQPSDAPAFFALNEQWISRHFGMEPRDHLNLGNPQQTILDPGGHILMAVAGARPVGCCALIPELHPATIPDHFSLKSVIPSERGPRPACWLGQEVEEPASPPRHDLIQPTVYELAKMAVAEDLRSQGLGRRILLATVALARSLGAQRLTLGSSTRLPDAVHLYESIGFRHIPPELRQPSPYARADVFMEMTL